MKKTLLNASITAVFTLSSFSALSASYQIVEVETPERFEQAYPRDINEQGDVVGVVRGIDYNSYIARGSQTVYYANSSVLYDHPIDVTQLDFEDQTLLDTLKNNRLLAFLLNDVKYFDLDVDYIDEVKAGQFTLESKSLVLFYLYTGNLSGTPKQLDGRYHQIGEYWSAVSIADSLQHFPIMDTINPETNQLSYEFNETTNAINDNGWIVGATESPYHPAIFDDSGEVSDEYHVQEYVERGYVKIGDNIIILDPVDTSFRGGRSIATDVSNSGYVVGHVSTQFQFDNDQLALRLNECIALDILEAMPEEVCFWRLRENSFGKYGQSGSQQASSLENLGKTETQVHHAYRWKLDEFGNIIEETDLGVGFNENADNHFTLYSQASAVNESGNTVGRTHIYTNDDETRITQVAFVYDDELTTIADDLDEYLASSATDINNNNIVIGDVRVRVNFASSGINKAFYYDSANGSEPVIIDDGIETSNTQALGINDNNQIVGHTDVISVVTSSGRKHGFLYNIDDQSFLDLNDLVECESEYTIISAEAINNDGTILATATRPGPLLDVMGQPVLDSLGEVVRSSFATIVKLVPIENGVADNCFTEENTIKRQGGAWSWLLMIFVFASAAYRQLNRVRIAS